MPTLYYVDDERTFIKYIRAGWKCERSDIVPYVGAGASDVFFDNLYIGKINTKNSFFLFDARMSVPDRLEKEREIWDNYTGSRKADVCGFAIASYLIKKHGVALDHIKIISAYLNIIAADVEQFDLQEVELWGKDAFDLDVLAKWCKSATR